MARKTLNVTWNKRGKVRVSGPPKMLFSQLIPQGSDLFLSSIPYDLLGFASKDTRTIVPHLESVSTAEILIGFSRKILRRRVCPNHGPHCLPRLRAAKISRKTCADDLGHGDQFTIRFVAELMG